MSKGPPLKDFFIKVSLYLHALEQGATTREEVLDWANAELVQRMTDLEDVPDELLRLVSHDSERQDLEETLRDIGWHAPEKDRRDVRIRSWYLLPLLVAGKFESGALSARTMRSVLGRSMYEAAGGDYNRFEDYDPDARELWAYAEPRLREIWQIEDPTIAEEETRQVLRYYAKEVRAFLKL